MLLVFTVILIAIRRNLSLGNSFLLGSVCLGFLFGMGPIDMAGSILVSVTLPKTLSLAAINALILVLSQSMEAAGLMQRLLANFQGLVKSVRLNLIVFPAIIGLLPMPGGTVFSAPMVKTLGAHLKLSGAQLSFVNFWFRHIWEYWWPLYPGVLLATTLAHVDIWTFALFLFPLTPVAFSAGYFLLSSFAGGKGDEPEKLRARPPLGPFLRELSPLAITIGGGIGLGVVLSLALPPDTVPGRISKELGLILALGTAILWVWRDGGFTRARVGEILGDPMLLRMIYMVVTILAFKGVLEDSRAIDAISGELLAMHIPLMPITVVLPFMVGGVVGITIAYVGTTFPILIALVQSFGESQHLFSYMMLAMVSGFVGVLVSPLHLCLLLSNEYFGAGLRGVYRYLIMPCSVLIVAGAVYFLLLHWTNGF